MMRTKYLYSALASAILLMPFAAWAQARPDAGAASGAHGDAVYASPTSLAESIAFALVHNPAVRGAESEVEARSEEVDGAKSGLWPKFGIGTQLGRQPDTTAYPDGRTVTTRTTSASLTYTVWDGGKAREVINEKKASVKAGIGAFDEQADKVVMQTIASYMGVLRANALIELANRNVESHSRIIGLLRDIVRYDPGRRSDLLLGLGRLEQATLAVSSAGQQLDAAKSAFEEVVGSAPGTLARPNDDSFSALLPASLDDARMMAIDYSPSVRRARSDAEVAQASAEELKRWYSPSLDVQLNRPLSVTPSVPGGTSASVVFSMSLDSGTALAGKSAYAAALRRIESARQELVQERRGVEHSTTDQWSAVQVAASQLPGASTQATQTREMAGLYWEQFKIDRRTLMEALNAENEAYLADVSRVQISFDMAIAKLNLLVLTGRVYTQMAITRPAVATDQD